MQSLRESLGRYLPLPRLEAPLGVSRRRSKDTIPQAPRTVSWQPPEDPAESFLCPSPGSERFWKMYGEPLEEFVRAFTLVGRALKILQGEPVEGSYALVDALLAPVGHGIRPRTGDAPAEQILTPTLLSALTMAALRAAGDGRHMKSCDFCGRVYFSEKALRRYCTEGHKRAAQNRAFRSEPSVKRRERKRRRKVPLKTS